MTFARWVLATLALAFGGCAEAEPVTQITFRLHLSSALQARVQTLEVAVRSERNQESRDFEGSELRWPVEIVVVPEGGNQAFHQVTLTATAKDGSGVELARKQRAESFAWKQQRRFDVALDDGVVLDAGTDAGDSRDSGEEDAGEELDARASQDAGEDAEPDGGDDLDAEAGAPNCETPGANIVCDDQNPCNGLELCRPTQTAANALGCMAGTPVACGSDLTCDPTSGNCTPCIDNADADRDGVRSSTCGGTDCDDSDPEITPGKDELCDGKDNDCLDGVDGPSADQSCVQPTGGSAICLGARCLESCLDPTQQIVDGGCVAQPITCPSDDPCFPDGDV